MLSGLSHVQDLVLHDPPSLLYDHVDTLDLLFMDSYLHKGPLGLLQASLRYIQVETSSSLLEFLIISHRRDL